MGRVIQALNMFELEGFDREAYSPAIIERVETATNRLLRLGVVQLLQGLEFGLKQASGKFSPLAATKEKLRFYGLSIGFGYLIGGKPMDNDNEIAGKQYLAASYDLETEEIVICGTKLAQEKWTPESAKEIVFKAALLQTYTPDLLLYDLFRPSIDNSRN